MSTFIPRGKPKNAKQRARQKKAKAKCEEYHEQLYFLNSPNSPYNQLSAPRPYQFPYQPKISSSPRYSQASNNPNMENNTDPSLENHLPTLEKSSPPPPIPIQERFQEKRGKTIPYNALPETLPMPISRNRYAADSNNFRFEDDITKDVVWDLFLWPLLKEPFKNYLEAESFRKKDSVLRQINKTTVTYNVNLKKKRILDEELEDIAKLNDGWVRKERHPRKPFEIRLRKRKIC